MRITLSNLCKPAVLLFSAISLSFSSVAQQTPMELLWKSGTVYLTSGDSITGQVSLTIPRDVVSVRRHDGTLSAFATVNVADFVVQDEQNTASFRAEFGPLEFMRHYKTYMWNRNNDYSNFLSPAFFVVVQPGPYTLLMRETKSPAPVHTSRYPSDSQLRSDRILQHFYLAKPNNEVVALRNPKKDLQTLFPNLKDEMVRFARANRLDFDEPLQLARIIEFCNRSI